MMGFGWMHGYGGMGLLGGLIGLIFNLVVIAGIAMVGHLGCSPLHGR